MEQQEITLKLRQDVTFPFDHVQLGRNQTIKIKKWTKQRILMVSLLSLLASVTLYTLVTMDYGNLVVITAFKQFLTDSRTIFLEPTLSGRFPIQGLLLSLMMTLSLAVITTILAMFLAFGLALLAARNLSSKRLSYTIRLVMSVIRAVPTILWVLIFSIIMGLGANAAVIGMLFHSVAYLTKTYSESIEEIDEGVIEALKASGANWFQIVGQAILPSTVTMLLSWTFLRFEINFTNAIAVGAAAGAGGLGFELAMTSGFYFDLHEIGVLVYLIFMVAAILEILSNRLKHKYISRG